MIEIDVVTPARQIVRGLKADSIRLPAEKGEIEVLPGHASLLTLLGTGVMAFKTEGTERRFAISYGFAEIHQDKVIVLAETCEETQEIDYERAMKAKEKAEAQLSGTMTREEYLKMERKLQRALVRTQLSGKRNA